MKKLALVLFAGFLLSPISGHAGPGERWLNLLRQGAYTQLEDETVAFQAEFAAGKQTEFALRDAYRPLYDLTDSDLRRLDEWQKMYPKSYSSRLIRGTYYKRAGFQARGDRWAKDTSQKQWADMAKLHAVAVDQLQKSIPLTEKPYLSIWHLIDLQEDDKADQKALLDTGTKMLPSNRLVRARYMHHLTPRWGGSYEAMQQFMVDAKKSGATEKGLLELEAIMDDDMGDALIRAGHEDQAVKYFARALDLKNRIGELAIDLDGAEWYRCKLAGLAAYCR
jgi:hypothetical protein